MIIYILCDYTILYYTVLYYTSFRQSFSCHAMMSKRIALAWVCFAAMAAALLPQRALDELAGALLDSNVGARLGPYKNTESAVDKQTWRHDINRFASMAPWPLRPWCHVGP